MYTNNSHTEMISQKDGTYLIGLGYTWQEALELTLNERSTLLEKLADN